MKKVVSLLLIFCCTYIVSYAQFSESMKEKVRDPLLAAYLTELFEHQNNFKKYNTHIPDDFPTLQEFIKTLEITKKYRRMSTSEYLGAEPFIAVNHNNPNRVVASFMADFGGPGGSSGLKFPIYFSNDGGVSWTKSEFNTSEAIDEQLGGISIFGGGDPVLAIDNNGRVHMTFIYVHGQIENSYFNMFYCYSDDNGENWTLPNPSKLPTDGLDRQWMAVDNSGGTYDGNLYLSAALFFSDSVGEYIAIKNPQNDMFDSTIVRAVATDSVNTLTQFGNIKVDHQGTIHLACLLYNETDSGAIVYVQSTDGGQSFTEPKTIASAKNAKQSIDNKIHNRENTASSMAVDKNNVYITWTDFANDDIRSYYVYSNDGGSTFSTPIEFGTQLINTNSNYHFMPFVCADNGKMVLAWSKIDKQSKSSEYVFTTSLDSGLTLSTPQPLLEENFTHINDELKFYGDYNSSDMIGCEAHFSFTASVGTGESTQPVVYFKKRNVCDGVGLSEISPVSDQFSLAAIYPNPSKNNIHVDFFIEEKQQVLIDVFNTKGQKVKSYLKTDYYSGQHQLTLDISDLSPNSYLLRMTLQNGLFASRRFLIQ